RDHAARGLGPLLRRAPARGAAHRAGALSGRSHPPPGAAHRDRQRSGIGGVGPRRELARAAADPPERREDGHLPLAGFGTQVSDAQGLLSGAPAFLFLGGSPERFWGRDGDSITRSDLRSLSPCSLSAT